MGFFTYARTKKYSILLLQSMGVIVLGVGIGWVFGFVSFYFEVMSQ